MSWKIFLLTCLLGLLPSTACMVVITSGEISSFDANPNPCAEGPGYWCKHIANAKSCHAVKHCIQTVWERQVVSEDAGDNICDICKEMVQEAKDQLMSNETQEELKLVFEGSCKLIPIKLISMECIKVFDGFIPELIEMLSSQMNPSMVCTTAGLCNSQWSDQLQAEYHAAKLAESSNVGHGNCECASFAEKVFDKLKMKSKADMQNALLQVCGKMNSFSDGCHALVMENIDQIYEFINKELNTNQFCQFFNICENRPQVSSSYVEIQPLSNDRKYEANLKALETNAKDDMECEFCEALVKHVRDILTTNTTEEEFRKVLESLCKQTRSFASQCTSLTDQYYDMIYTFLTHEMEPRQVCRLLTLCGNSHLLDSADMNGSWYLKISAEPSVLPVSRLFPAQKISNNDLVGQDERKSLTSSSIAFQLPAELYSPSIITSASARKDPGCIFCEYVLHQIVTELHNETVDKDIEQAVKNICSRLPSSISDECDKFVDTYGDALLFLLSQELDPSVACVNLQLCPSQKSVELPQKPFTSSSFSDPNTCALCEFVITELDHKLEDQKTEEAIKRALENICGYMPQSVRKDCTRLVDAYSNEIVEMLLADLTPEEVCTALKFCKPKVGSGFGSRKHQNEISVGEFLAKMEIEPFYSSSQNVQNGKEVSKPKAAPSATCVLCEFAMMQIDKMLLTNSTEDQVKRSIDFVCGHLPDTIADMCIDFVEQYGDEIFEMLVKEMAPKVVCSQMGLCTAQPKTLNKTPLLGADGHDLVAKIGTCQICETVVEYLDQLLEDDTIEESIDQIIEKACKYIPAGAQQKCQGIVDTYGPYLLHQLGILMDKTKVCQSVHLCKPPPGQVQLLGGDHCTFGPSYWCVSQEHAEACNALKHCQSKGWMNSEP